MSNAMINANLVKKLREMTGVGMMTCKEALRESGGNMEKAVEILRKQGHAKAARKATRAAADGQVASYIHLGGKIGVLAEINCETDFAARSEAFNELVKDLTMQIAAASPRFVSREDVPQELIDKEIEIYKAQIGSDGKPRPPQAIEKIINGKLDKFYQDACLMEQPFVKNPDITVKDHIASFVAKIGENIVVRRFARYKLGEEA